MKRRDDILAAIRNAPSLPPASRKIMSLLNDPDVDLGELTRALEFDQGLTGNVLRMANSAYFGSPRQVRTVREALVRLGLSRIHQIVISSTVAGVLRRPVQGYGLGPNELWEHSAAAALATLALAQHVKRMPPDYTFTAALVHDTGKIVLGSFVNINVKEITALAFGQRVSFEQAERDILGIDHAEVGAELLDAWNLPKEIVTAVRWHHDPRRCEEPDRHVVELLHVADHVCQLSGIGAGLDGANYAAAPGVLEEMGLRTRDLEEVVCHAVKGLDALRAIFRDEPMRSGR